jgi:hypothetical protein
MVVEKGNLHDASSSRYPGLKGPALGCPIRGFINKYMNQRILSNSDSLAFPAACEVLQFEKMKKQK